jgi:hypothetical protein
MTFTKRALFRCALLLLSVVSLIAAINAQQRAAKRTTNVPVDEKLLQGLRYRSIGPARGGRVTAVAGHRKQPHTFYMGATGGGVWKTTDAGQNWANISDGFFETASIGAIAVAESDPNVVYVGTGSAAIRSNVIQGRGVYKSTDAGKTWRHIGLREVGQIGSVRVHPQIQTLPTSRRWDSRLVRMPNVVSFALRTAVRLGRRCSSSTTTRAQSRWQ